ncbi:MAG: hypothetical protein IT381_30895 [Deltaproteobacteria bacterium]|nr:hypothetical protein [Deltaproteobacteria bacterium]
MMKSAPSPQAQRKELLSDWLANRKAETLRARHLRNTKVQAVASPPRRETPRPR